MLDPLSVEAAAATVKAGSIGIPRHSTITTRTNRSCGLTRDDASARGSRGGGGGARAGGGGGVAHLAACVVVVSVLCWDVIREEEKTVLGRSIYRNAVDVVALFTRTRRLFSQLESSKSNRSGERNARIDERLMKKSQRTGRCNQRLKG